MGGAFRDVGFDLGVLNVLVLTVHDACFVIALGTIQVDGFACGTIQLRRFNSPLSINRLFVWCSLGFVSVECL